MEWHGMAYHPDSYLSIRLSQTWSIASYIRCGCKEHEGEEEEGEIANIIIIRNLISSILPTILPTNHPGVDLIDISRQEEAKLESLLACFHLQCQRHNGPQNTGGSSSESELKWQWWDISLSASPPATTTTAAISEQFAKRLGVSQQTHYQKPALACWKMPSPGLVELA